MGIRHDINRKLFLQMKNYIIAATIIFAVFSVFVFGIPQNAQAYCQGAGVTSTVCGSTTSIGLQVDEMTGLTLSYFDLAVAKFWPLVLGFALLIAVYAIGRRVYVAITN